MEVLSITDQEDGSAIIEVEMTEKERDLFTEIGFLKAVEEGIKTHEDSFRTSVSE